MSITRRFQRLPQRLKVTFLLIFLTVLLGVGVFIWAIATGKILPKAEGEQGSFYLVYNPIIYKDQVVDVDIYASSNTPVDVVALKYLNFNNALLEAIDEDVSTPGVQIKSHSFYDYSTVENSVDNANGTIAYRIERSSTAYNLGANTRIATVTFLAKALGVANLNFNFTSGQVGDCDIITKANGTDLDILSSASSSSINIIVEATAPPTDTPTEEPTEEPTERPTEQPTAEPTQPPTEEPTAEPSAEPTAEETIVPEATPTEIALASPTLEPGFSPPVSIEPASPSPEIHIARFGISKTMSLILFIAIPIFLTLGIYFIWWWKKHKPKWFEKDSKEKDEAEKDDEEI